MAKKLAFDMVLFLAVMCLVCIGLTMVYSATAAMTRDALNPFLVKQAVAALLGLAVMVALMHADYRILRSPVVAWSVLGFALALLVLVLFSPALNDTNRWLFVGGISIQPSEIAKLALICFLAVQIERKADRLGSAEFLLPVLFAVGAMVLLVLQQPNLSAALLIATVAVIVAFLGGLPWRLLAALGALAVPLVVGAIVVAPYRLERVLAYLDPDKDVLGANFQASQSLIAVGSGGLWGRGLGSSVQKLHFLPYPHADYVFSILAEEMGLIGAVAVLVLFGIVAWRGIRAGLRAPDLLGRHLAWGITSLLVVQALLHVSVVLAMLPSTGVPLPFIAYGGSAMVVMLAACGLLLNVSQHG
jgi:cell division protein FtsW